MKTITLFLLAAVMAWATPEARTWTDTQGRKIEAVFVNANETTVTMLRDGKQLAIPLATLSKADLVWVGNEVTALDARLTVIQVTKDGVLASGIGKRGPATETKVKRKEAVPGTGLDAGRTVTKEWVETVSKREFVYLPKTVFVRCNTKGLVDDSSIMLRIWPDGTYAYTTVLGAQATVPAYTTTPPTP